jgi:hypothetical protein
MTREHSKRQFVVCVSNKGYEASLELRKIYQRVPDEAAAKRGLIRVIDESEEDYLYPESCFAPIEVPKSIEESLRT